MRQITGYIKAILVTSFLAISLLLAQTEPAAATDYYVSTSGSDSNTGLSEALAWKTIQYAADYVNAGDTVHVQAGTYTEQVTITKSGIAGNPITFRGEGMPTLTRTGTWYGDGPIVIRGSYITITGFRIFARDNVYDSSKVVGVLAAYGSGATNLNISNNYIWTQSGYGVNFLETTGSFSSISNNEIHTGHQAGIIFDSPNTLTTNVDIINNTIYADENFQHRDWSDASGIGTFSSVGTNYQNLNVSYNKILASGYTGIKIAGTGHRINYNEVGPRGFAHNAIEVTQGDTEMIGNRVYDTDLSWPTQFNAFYSAGRAQASRKNLILRDNTASNSLGRALTIGGLEHHFIVENFSALNYRGKIQIGDVEEDLYPWPVRVTGNGILYNVSLETVNPGDYPISIISLGEATTPDHTNWNAYRPSDITFIDLSVTGTYVLPTFELTTSVGYSSNAHFEGTIHVINSNMDDVSFSKQANGTHNGTIIFYYYADAEVVDMKGDPIEGANVSFVANDPAIKAKNTNYKYMPFPDGVTQNISYTFTGPGGHTPLPSNASSTVAIADFKQTIAGKTYYTWTITAEKDGFTNSTTVNPDAAWYRLNPDTYQNTITITLPITGTLPIDINQDGTIDISDLRIVALHFGESTALPYPRYDVNTDGTVDILDLRQVAGGM